MKVNSVTRINSVVVDELREETSQQVTDPELFNRVIKRYRMLRKFPWGVHCVHVPAYHDSWQIKNGWPQRY